MNVTVGDHLVYKGDSIEVMEISGSMSKILKAGADDWDAFWVPMMKLIPAPKERLTLRERLSRLEDVSEELVEYLHSVGVIIRVYCAPEHKDTLVWLLENNGATLPDDFECSAVHERGGEYRPWAPGFICIFPAPPEGMATPEFTVLDDGRAHIARTAFGLKLISLGFPITTWKKGCKI
jgi:hypothetical protein